MRHALRILLAAGLIALPATVFAACGGDDDEGGDSQAASPTPDDGVPTIDQDDLRFKPDELTVAVGETVRFTNSETALHTVTIDGDNLSGNMKKDDIFEWTPAEAGEYKVTCEYHPQMRATVTVR